jgi:hypothetical protein
MFMVDPPPAPGPRRILAADRAAAHRETLAKRIRRFQVLASSRAGLSAPTTIEAVAALFAFSLARTQSTQKSVMILATRLPVGSKTTHLRQKLSVLVLWSV